MTDAGHHVRRRTISGFRWSIALNAVSTPLSLVTNVLLARAAPLALGFYSATQIFVGTFQTFFFLGGRQVFTRFVPSLRKEDRLSFLASYLGVLLAFFAVVLAVGSTVGRPWALFLLEKFGDPPPAAALVLAVTVVIWASASHYLFGVLQGGLASATLKTVVVGFFVAGLLAYGPLRSSLLDDPSNFIWTAALLVYIVGCLFGIACVLGLRDVAGRRRLRPFLPPGFWQVVMYAQAGTLVEFVYSSLSPVVVLLWIDIGALANLHAALRFPVFLRMIPAMLADVLAPGLAELDASGLREQALRHASDAIRAMYLIAVPVSLALVFFAGDAMAIFGSTFSEHRDLLRIVAVSSIAAPMVHVGTGMVAAFGLFRTYLAASMVYVVVSLALAFTLIPAYGLTGAALSTTISAFAHQVTYAVVLRRHLQFKVPGRAYVSWIIVTAASIGAVLTDPERLSGAAAFIVCSGLFVVAGRVTPGEIVGITKKLARR